MIREHSDAMRRPVHSKETHDSVLSHGKEPVIPTSPPNVLRIGCEERTNRSTVIRERVHQNGRLRLQIPHTDVKVGTSTDEILLIIGGNEKEGIDASVMGTPGPGIHVEGQLAEAQRSIRVSADELKTLL